MWLGLPASRPVCLLWKTMGIHLYERLRLVVWPYALLKTHVQNDSQTQGHQGKGAERVLP